MSGAGLMARLERLALDRNCLARDAAEEIKRLLKEVDDLKAEKSSQSGRARAAPAYTPTDVLAARGKAGHTQTDAAALVYRTLRGWQDWESGERSVDPAVFELYLRKTEQL